MKIKRYLKNYFSLFAFLILVSCGSDDESYIPQDDDGGPILESPVNFNIDEVPYQTLSEYNFYEDDLDDLIPVYGVLPYEPITQLFTDYAKKSRFVWMPKEVQAEYVGDGNIFNFPTGAVLIKNFYYNNVLPGNSKKIIETRLMIKKADGWIFANYVWNESQTEATLDPNGSFVNIEWLENGQNKSVVYRIPSNEECLMCHKNYGSPIPIGPKPQNINSIFNYADGTENQLNKWKEMGYLMSNYPSSINTVVNWNDQSKTTEERVRSYVDANCSHCHSSGGHCDYRSLDLTFLATTDLLNMGVCDNPQEDISEYLGYVPTHIIKPGDLLNSTFYIRVNTNEEAIKMPMTGRSLVHEEFVSLLGNWINNLTEPCD